MFEQQELGRYFLNSLIVAGCVVIASALIAFLAATAVTRFRFRFRTTLLIMFLVAQMVPVEALTIPLFFLMRDFGQLNTLGSLILPHIAFALPFAIWMLRGFVKAVPEALEEAAYIDGASRTRFLWQILFPPNATQRPLAGAQIGHRASPLGGQPRRLLHPGDIRETRLRAQALPVDEYRALEAAMRRWWAHDGSTPRLVGAAKWPEHTATRRFRNCGFPWSRRIASSPDQWGSATARRGWRNSGSTTRTTRPGHQTRHLATERGRRLSLGEILRRTRQGRGRSSAARVGMRARGAPWSAREQVY
ncbi:hypothetical protein STENM327S_01944 [Streptomyces tendae]